VVLIANVTVGLIRITLYLWS